MHPILTNIMQPLVKVLCIQCISYAYNALHVLHRITCIQCIGGMCYISLCCALRIALHIGITFYVMTCHVVNLATCASNSMATSGLVVIVHCTALPANTFLCNGCIAYIGMCVVH